MLYSVDLNYLCFNYNTVAKHLLNIFMAEEYLEFLHAYWRGKIGAADQKGDLTIHQPTQDWLPWQQHEIEFLCKYIKPGMFRFYYAWVDAAKLNEPLRTNI